MKKRKIKRKKGSKIVLTTTDNRSFFKRVLDYGIENRILFPERLRQLSGSLKSFHVRFCRMIGYNHLDLSETLLAAKLMEQLLSVSLEVESGNDLIKAAHLLTEKLAKDLVIKLLKKVKFIIGRLKKVIETILVNKTKFGYTVKIYYFKAFRELYNVYEVFVNDLLSLSDLDKFLIKVLKPLKSIGDYQNLVKSCQDLEFAYKTSRKFLPWKYLKDDAGLKLLTIDEQMASGQPDFSWDIGTLIRSFVATAICGGSHRFFSVPSFVSEYSIVNHRQNFYLGVVFPQSFLDKLINNLEGFEEFKIKARKIFISYLHRPGGGNEKVQIPNKKEMIFLLDVFEQALESFKMKEGRGNFPKKSNVLAWAERLHLEMQGIRAVEKQVFRKYGPGGTPIKKGKKKSLFEKLQDAFQRDANNHSIGRYLGRVNWKQAIDEEFIETIFREVKPDVIIRHIALELEPISKLLDYWESYFGKKEWVEKYKLKMVDRLLEQAFYSEFWFNADMTNELIRLCPEKADAIRRKFRDNQ